MKSKSFLLALVSLSLTSCSSINQTFDALESNRMAIDYSTSVINENAQAIQRATIAIEHNRQQLEKINQTLNEAAKS